jgi:hypothetical protein
VTIYASKPRSDVQMLHPPPPTIIDCDSLIFLGYV